MPNLNDFIDPDLTAADVVHSNGYASAAASGMGAGAGGLSLDQRRQLANRQRTVGAYVYSHLGRRQSALKARTADQKAGRVFDASSGNFEDRAKFSHRQRGGASPGGSTEASVAKRQRFIEPPARGHNPYA